MKATLLENINYILYNVQIGTRIEQGIIKQIKVKDTQNTVLGGSLKQR